jgi:putative nucleotidyltransferase with HDIG domain
VSPSEQGGAGVPARPSRRFLLLEGGALVGAMGLALARAGHADWDLGLLAALFTGAVIADLIPVSTGEARVRLSASFLAIVTAAVLGGATPAALIAVVSILVAWTRLRYAPADLLVNLVTYAWFPLITGLAFHAAIDGAGVDETAAIFYVFVFGAFLLALGLDFLLIAGYSCYVERSSLGDKVRRALLPLLPSELASALLTVGITYAYVELGLPALALFGVVLLVFQWLIAALLTSQQRADELELRAKQLAGFQVALLSALLRTLDLRDRMTARHSAAVARYAREVAAAAGMSDEEQELAHTAGLLHDIGKFALPDPILRQNVELTLEDWERVRTHPYEGARIVSQIDGYQPIGEIILAHHERFDGRGYPRGLQGDEIPEIARIIAVGEAYDAMTARDSYRQELAYSEAVAELRRAAGTQFDPRFVELLSEVLSHKDSAYRHGEADFEAELALDRRIHEQVTRSGTTAPVGTAGVASPHP